MASNVNTFSKILKLLLNEKNKLVIFEVIVYLLLVCYLPINKMQAFQFNMVQ